MKNSYSGKQAPKISIVGIQKSNRNGLTTSVTGLMQQLQQVTGIEIKGLTRCNLSNTSKTSSTSKTSKTSETSETSELSELSEASEGS